MNVFVRRREDDAKSDDGATASDGDTAEQTVQIEAEAGDADDPAPEAESRSSEDQAASTESEVVVRTEVRRVRRSLIAGAIRRTVRDRRGAASTRSRK